MRECMTSNENSYLHSNFIGNNNENFTEKSREN